MLNTEMLARMRTFLDEETAVFYNDNTELYPALSLAQIEVCKAMADSWKQKQLYKTVPTKVPIGLSGLRTIETGTISSGAQTVAITGNPLQVLTVIWQFDGAIVASSPMAVECAEGADSLRLWLSNPLKNGTYFFWRKDLLTVNPISTNNSAGYTLIFYDTPVDITASVQPESDVVAHDAIIERALWILLKDREVEQANTHLQMYVGLLGGLTQ